MRLNLSRRRTPVACLALSTALFATASFADGTQCDLDARAVFAMTRDKVVELFAVGVNPQLVAGRIVPRSGTGFLIDGGYIATNFHVIADAPLVVANYDGQTYDIEFIGSDPALDIALLKPWPPIQGAEAIEIAPADSIETGEPAYVVGFPLGVGISISAGIVSATNRVLPATTSSWLAPMVQTDAAVSGGNSGGPLLDDCGRVIGMITSAISGENAENLGFAIRSDVLVPEFDALIKDGVVARPWHGLFGKMTDPGIFFLLGIPEEEWEDSHGFLIETVEFQSDAFRAGLQGGIFPAFIGGMDYLLGGDIILSVDGQRIDSMDKAISTVRGLAIGETVEIEYLREGSRDTVAINLTQRPILSEDINFYRHAAPPE